MKDNFKYYQIVAKSKQNAMSVSIATKNSRSKPLLHEYKDPKDKDAPSVTRALRYAENKPSPFEDEQHGHVVLSPIIFEDGLLKVEKSRSNLIQFLDLHPDNLKNGGKLFKERDFEEEAREDEDFLDAEFKAQELARKLSGSEYEAIHRMISKDTDRLDSVEIRRDVKKFARNNPFDFLDMVDSPDLEKSEFMSTIISEELVTFRANGQIHYNLPDNKKMITRTPKGQDSVLYFEEFLMTNEGLEALTILEEYIASM